MLFHLKKICFLAVATAASVSSANVNYPCSGAPGVYRTNPDQSPGGFVAKTATVDATIKMEPETSVCERATVIEGAQLLGRASISGKATVRGNVIISDNVKVYGEAYVINPGGGLLYVKNNAKIYGHGFLQGSIIVGDSSEVFGWGKILGYAQILGTSKVCGKAIVKDFEVLTDDNSRCVQK